MYLIAPVKKDQHFYRDSIEEVFFLTNMPAVEASPLIITDLCCRSLADRDVTTLLGSAAVFCFTLTPFKNPFADFCLGLSLCHLDPNVSPFTCLMSYCMSVQPLLKASFTGWLISDDCSWNVTQNCCETVENAEPESLFLNNNTNR